MFEQASAAGASVAEHLQRLTVTLAATHSRPEVLKSAMQLAMTALRAGAGVMVLLDRDTLCLSVAAVQGNQAATLWQDGPLSSETPAGDALLKGRPLYFEHAGALKDAYPHLEAQTGGMAAVATAVLPLMLEGQPLGVLILDFKEPHTFPAEEQGFLQALASQTSVALDRADLISTLDTQVRQRTAQLEAEREALQAFAAFNRATTETSDVCALAEQAIDVLRAVLKDVSVGYYERAGDLWQARVWSDTMAPDVIEVIRAGLPVTAPAFSAVMASRTSLFLPGFDAAAEGAPEAQSFKAAAFFPCLVDDDVRGVLAMGTQLALDWSLRDRQVFEAVGSSLTLTLERTEIARQLQAQKEEAERRSQALAAFEQLSRDLMHETDRYALICRAQEILLTLLPSGLAVYYELEANLWRVKAQVSDIDIPELQVYLDRGLPAEAASPRFAWTTGEPLYQDDYAQGSDLPPEAGQAVKATVTMALRLQGQPIGIFSVGLFEQRIWTAVDRMILNTAAQSLELALDRAAQTQQLEEERAGLAAFAAFTEAVGVESDVSTLARQAVEVLQATLPDLTVAYYERLQDHWVGRVWSDDLPAEVATQVQAGVPVAAPDFAQAVQSGAPVFVDRWDALGNELSEATMYGAAGFLPLTVEGRTQSLLAVGKQSGSSWSERERVIVRAVGQGLTQALARLEVAMQVQQQRDQAESRARALEAFVVLSRDLAGETSRHVLVHRAQEIMLSLLTPGYALYWEEGQDRWELKSQVGDIGDPALQRLVDEQGLPLDTPALHSTWLTGTPNYQDHYDQGADTPAELIRHVQAATAFRVEAQGQPVGMLAIGLFDQRFWTPMDKAMLETAIYSLGLVLERARSVEALAERTRELEVANHDLQAANEELEAFTYSASHDLRTPVRHVMGFAELAQKALEKGQDDKVRHHLEVVKQAAQRMTDLIDGMLLLSRSGRQELKVRSVDLTVLVTQARRDAATEFGSRPVRWQIGDLPTVQGDAQLLQQVMTNLLSNAVKYSAKREVSEVRVRCEARASEWCVSVMDNGVGFDPHYTQKLFGIFQRLHTESSFRGTGVGLATVKRIVQKHGGRVFAQSDGRTGATFGFTLPR